MMAKKTGQKSLRRQQRDVQEKPPRKLLFADEVSLDPFSFVERRLRWLNMIRRKTIYNAMSTRLTVILLTCAIELSTGNRNSLHSSATTTVRFTVASLLIVKSMEPVTACISLGTTLPPIGVAIMSTAKFTAMAVTTAFPGDLWESETLR